MEQRQLGRRFRVRSDMSLCEGVPPKHVESIKLPRVGTVKKFERGFFPAFPERQHEAREDATAANHPKNFKNYKKVFFFVNTIIIFCFMY